MFVSERSAHNRFLLVYVIWWVGWFFVADNLRRVHISSEATAAVFTSIGAVVVGAGIARLNGPATTRADVAPVAEPWIVMALRVCVGIQVILLVLAVKGMLTFGVEYRSLYFKDPGLIFGSNNIWLGYVTIVMPISSYLIVRWLSNGGNLEAWLGYVVVMGFLEATIANGRFALYETLFFIGIARVLGHKVQAYQWLAVLGVAVPFAFGILYYRTGVGSSDINHEQLGADSNAILEYHALGFYLFDYHITHHFIRSFYPLCNSIGIFGLPLYGFSKYALGFTNPVYCYQEMQTELDRHVKIEDYGDTNAFGTNLLPFYVDGGLLLVGLVFIAAGYALFHSSTSGRRVSPISISVLYVLVFGLFQPVLNGPQLVVPVLIHAALKVVTGRRAVRPATPRARASSSATATNG